MKLEIVLYGHPVLKEKGERIEKITPEIRKLAADMLHTIEGTGIGLAAQQIGRALQIAVIDVSKAEDQPSKMWIQGKAVDSDEQMPLVLINPEIDLSKSQTIEPEGCLSFPEIYGDIVRSRRVRVRATDLDGNDIGFDAEGLLARAVQHEYDHLQGILFIDRMISVDRKRIEPQIQALHASFKK